jgi:hypothetical protein
MHTGLSLNRNSYKTNGLLHSECSEANKFGQMAISNANSACTPSHVSTGHLRPTDLVDRGHFGHSRIGLAGANPISLAPGTKIHY